jgi:hypothetical protein
MWAKWDRYTDPVPAERWLHNLQHGGIALLYRPDAPPEVIQALSEAYDQIPPYVNPDRDAGLCGNRLALMAPDSELDDTFAVLSWGHLYRSDCVPDVAAVVDFAVRRTDSAAESACSDGAWPVREPCHRTHSTQPYQWTRVVPDGEAVTYDNEPPGSGPHYAEWVRYGRYEEVIPRAYWVGNLEKGGMVIAYRPDADPSIITDLTNLYESLSDEPECGSSLTLMTPDPELTTPFAIVGWEWSLSGECVEDMPIRAFIEENRYNILREETTCDDGTYPAP